MSAPVVDAGPEQRDTAGPVSEPSTGRGRWLGRWRGRGTDRDGPNGDERRIEALLHPPAPREPPTPRQRWTSVLLATISVALVLFSLYLLVLSPLQHTTAQNDLYQQLRLSLAEGATPVTPVDDAGDPIALGTPVAVASFPTVGVSNEVVVEGSGSGQTMVGMGHRRDTVLPCQAGTSVLMARAGAYGGVGARWAWLQPGDQITITMGQGSCTYVVLAQRTAGDPAPAAPAGKQGRLVLTTAAGAPFLPTGVQRVDAELVGTAFDHPDVAISAKALPASEAAMAGDNGQLFGLVLQLQLLTLLVAASVWLWRRWNRWLTWLAAAPALLTVALLVAQSVALLLPNLM